MNDRQPKQLVRNLKRPSLSLSNDPPPTSLNLHTKHLRCRDGRPAGLNEMAGWNNQAIVNYKTGRKCYKCGEKGHYYYECESADRLCFNCGEPGHMSAECDKPKKVMSVGKVFALNVEEILEPDNLIRDTQDKEY